MKPRPFVVLVATTVILSALLWTPHTAFACSGSPGDWVAEADLIVLGQVTSVEPAPGTLGGGSIPVRLTLRVDRVLKGDAPDQLSYLESGVYGARSDDPDEWSYAGGDGSCATLRANPVGKHTVVLLTRDDQGVLTIVAPPAAPRYVDDPEQLAVVLARYDLPGLPATGLGGAANPSQPISTMAWSSVAGAIVAGGLWRARLRAARREQRRPPERRVPWPLEHRIRPRRTRRGTAG